MLFLQSAQEFMRVLISNIVSVLFLNVKHSADIVPVMRQEGAQA